jgi:cell division protein FtsB
MTDEYDSWRRYEDAKAFKNKLAEIDQLKAEIDMLKNRIEKLEAALQAIIKRAEFRNSEYVTDVVCSIARDALKETK